jgi:hypothetical protein
MKKLLFTLTLLFNVLLLNAQTTCSGTINYTDVPTRTNLTLAQAVEIGDGGAGQITVCIQEQHTDGKCGGTKPTLYVIYDDGTTNEAIYAIWTMIDSPDGTCVTFPLCGTPLYLKRTSCVNNDGSNSIISWSYDNYQGGDYKDRCSGDVIVSNGTQTDCFNAIAICDTGSYAGNADGSGIQELGCSSPSGNDGGCLLNGENNSAWYTFEARTDGTVTFDITPATNKDDYDFAIWGPDPSSCTSLGSPLRCNFALNKGPTGLNSTATWDEEDGGCVSGPGCTNTGYSEEITVVTGEVYYLLVDGFATAIDPNYSIIFGGTADIYCPYTPLSLDNTIVKPIIMDEEEMPEPLKILHYHTITGKELTKEESKKYKGIVVVVYEDGTRGKLPIKIE